MQYLTAIPVYGRVYDFGIRDNKFLLTNIEERVDREWPTLPLDVSTLEDYAPLMTNARTRLFMVSDETGVNKWIAVQTRHQCLLVDAPWRDVMQWLRVNIVDLGDGVFYVKHMALNYHMDLGNFYLYPELNPLNLPLKKQPQTLTIDDILSNISEVLNLAEIKQHLPLGKMGRFHKGLLVSGPHLWWIDKRNNLAYYLNEYFFEGAISFKKYLEQGDEDVGLFSLPRERDGAWDSPALTPAMVNGLLLDTDLEFIPATGTRISTVTKADKGTSGEYIIPGYGRFGRIDLTDRVVAMIRTRLGTCLGLDIRGERFVALYNISDIKALYIRENVTWTEPVVKQPMTEFVADPVVETVEPIIDLGESETSELKSTAYVGGFVGGWQSPADMSAVAAGSKETQPEVVVETKVEEPAVIDPIETISQEGTVNTLTIDETIHVSQPENSGEEFLKSLDNGTFKSKVVHSFMELALNDQPIICHGYIENHKDIEINRMLKGDIVLIDLGGVYGNLIPWTLADTSHSGFITGISNGEYFSSADKTILALDDKLFVADMHVNL